MTKLFILLLVALTLSACASNIPVEIQQDFNNGVTIIAVRSDIERYGQFASRKGRATGWRFYY